MAIHPDQGLTFESEHGLTFEDAYRRAMTLRAAGLVGISIFHKHQYEEIETDGACYTIHAYTGEELAALKRNAEAPDDPIPAFEVAHYYTDEHGNSCANVLAASDDLNYLAIMFAGIVRAANFSHFDRSPDDQDGVKALEGVID